MSGPISPSAALDRVAEAWRWLQQSLDGQPLPPVLAVIGLGDGYLLDALDRHAPATTVVALETDPDAAPRFRARPVGRAWEASGRLAYLVDPAYDGAERAFRVFPPGGDMPAVLLGPDHRLTPATARASQVLKKILFGVHANAAARTRFAPGFLRNVVRNAPAIARGADVAALAGSCRGLPAVVVGAGPSLDRVLPQLAARHDRAVVIAADTALRPLLDAGVIPSLVVGVDPGESNTRHFLSLPECAGTCLVAESALDRVATRGFDGRTFWFRAAAHEPWPWLQGLGVGRALLDVWGSVITAAFRVAELAGCDPIVFAGADLAWTGGQPYARRTTYEFDWACDAGCGHGLPVAWQARLAEQAVVQATDLHGQPTPSTGTLIEFRDWLVRQAERSGRRVINASRDGLLFGGGIIQAPLAAALGGAIQPPDLVAVAARAGRTMAPPAIGRALREVRAALARGDRARAPLASWVEFSGPRFDAEALADALDAAIADAAGRAPAAGRGPTLCTMGDLAADLRRWHTALTTGEAGPRGRASNGDDAVVCLAEAATLLAGIADADAAIGAHAGPPRDDVSLPVSVGYDWPQPLRWAVLQVEARLARALPDDWRGGRYFIAGSAWHAGAQSAAPAPVRASAAFARLAGLWHWTARQLPDDLRAALDAGVGVDRRPPLPDPVADPRLATGLLRTTSRTTLLAARVLTAEGLPPATVAYADDQTVVCVPIYQQASVRVDMAGRVVPADAWPRVIAGQAQMPDGSIVAWGNGMHDWPASLHDPYLFHRTAPGAPVVEHALPFRPTFASAWRDRLYVNCLAVPDDEWVGIGAWSPAGAVRLVDGLRLYGMHADGDTLRLDPCAYVPGVGYQFTPCAHGYTWDGTHAPVPRALSPEGAASASAPRGAWTATAHPDRHRIRLTHAGGATADLTCHAPLRLGWAGTSLVVSTTTRDVLLFPALADTLS